MPKPRYLMGTVAACEPAYLEQALNHVGGFVNDLLSKAGATGARYGVMATGPEAGSIVLMQGYEDLGGIEKAFQVYADSSDYQAVINSGKVSVTFRNITKLEDIDVANPSAEAPKYGVITRLAGPLMMDRLPKLMRHWSDNGAMVLRYGTLMTGNNAGMRLMVAGYPSMDAIEKTYDALRDDAEYKKILTEAQISTRAIVRIVG